MPIDLAVELSLHDLYDSSQESKMTEQERDETRRITTKDPAGVLAVLQPYVAPPSYPATRKHSPRIAA